MTPPRTRWGRQRLQKRRVAASWCSPKPRDARRLWYFEHRSRFDVGADPGRLLTRLHRSRGDRRASRRVPAEPGPAAWKRAAGRGSVWIYELAHQVVGFSGV
jgi:hypothetical protein